MATRDLRPKHLLLAPGACSSCSRVSNKFPADTYKLYCWRLSDVYSYTHKFFQILPVVCHFSWCLSLYIKVNARIFFSKKRQPTSTWCRKTYRGTTQTEGKIWNPKNFAPGGSEIEDGIIFCIFVQKSSPTSRWSRKLKFGGLVNGQPKPKEDIRNPDFFSPGVRNWRMVSSSICLSKKS
jgi:hypothetical protein